MITMGLGIGICNLPSQASGAAGFPESGRVALWLTRNVDAGGSYISNTWAETEHDGDLLKGAGHLGGSTASGVQNWTTTNATITAGSVGPDGKTSAARVTVSAANGMALSSGQLIPAGTYTLVVPIKSNTGASQSVKIGQNSTLTTHTVTTSWAEYTAVFTLASGSGGLIPIRDGGAGTMDVLIGRPRLFSGDVSGAVPAVQPLAGHLTKGLNGAPTLDGSAKYWSLASDQHFLPQFDDGIDFSTGAATHFHIAKRTSNPSGIAALFGLRENASRHMFGLRGSGRLCHGDGFAQTLCLDGILLANSGWQIIGVVVDPAANERRFYVGRQLVEVISGIGSNTSTTDRDFTIGLTSGGNSITADWMGGGLYNRALSATEWSQLVTSCEAEIVAHNQTAGTVHRFALVDGDSLVNDHAGNAKYYAGYANALVATPTLWANLAVPGDNIEDVDSRRAARARFLTDAANRDCVLMFSATNDVEVSGYPTTYASVGQQIVDGALADGFTHVVPCTLTPKTAVASPGYNAARATANTSIRAFTGIAAVCDFAADSRFGDDADASNAALYSDGVHATDLCKGYMGEVAASTLNGIP